MKPALIAIAAVLAVTGCATPTVYGPAAGPARVGFSDYRIEAGRYRVTFTGGGGAPIPQVADYALLRAAEVALRDGYDWFRVVDRVDQRAGAPGGSSLSVGTGTSSWGRRSSVGIGVGTSIDLSGGPAWSRTLEVLAGKGPAPRGGDVYDARAVIRDVGQGAGR
jgi:hypothetical protein